MGKNKKYHKTVYQSFAMITQFGINMLVPIFLCSFLGWYLDQKLGTAYLFIVLFFVGALAGFRNIFVLARKIYEDNTEDKNGYEAVRKAIAQEKSKKSKDIGEGDEEDEEDSEY